MEPDSQTIQPDLSFNEVRAGLLEAYAETEGLTMLIVVREYSRNTEFKHRIDSMALDLVTPSSRTIH
jgi:hypothetical protein